MPTFATSMESYLFWALMLMVIAGLCWVVFGLGRTLGRLSMGKAMSSREQELFTAQKSFKQVFEQEANALKQQITEQEKQIAKLKEKVEDYRRKAAGLGGLFGGQNKRGEAMYALLMENEALEQALMQQNEKLKQSQGDVVAEQLRQASYRRVLMTQLMADDRVKGVVDEIVDKRLPGPEAG